MALRAKPPEAVNKRLKLFMYSPAGVGKTTCACHFPKAYIIDAERGTENYDTTIKAAGSVVYQTVDIYDTIQEVKSLLSEKHDYRTLIIDPITPLYNDLLEKAEKKVGSDFGRHYGIANKEMKRLANLIMALDMNVIVTAHAKTEYGANLSKLGYTFDGWRSLDYWFDLVIELEKKGKKRYGKVVKSRIEGFPCDETFEWSYEAMKQRYGAELIERAASTVALATTEQVREIKQLLSVAHLPEGTVEKWLAKANAEEWEDMEANTISLCIDYVKARVPSKTTAAV